MAEQSVQVSLQAGSCGPPSPCREGVCVLEAGLPRSLGGERRGERVGVQAEGGGLSGEQGSGKRPGPIGSACRNGPWALP